ncbi:uncharacterized protein Z520_07822 [Fonsecaea multimorphosa CBS 102226]|uniref:Uncharacterized protein n=1 Tax=Fonsecaea multimorphosa CBS 102226 TaxID=1442371 RepID=A0A0D2IHN7_9EURO|nr:uncharacterized protein Z520_07822 [Fonsecaea multimorphosa CBS 102226]KIX96556.1 hypothetical protein Z520_07822 [Fonsecaea multimorphosa CBS 102226]OAL22169.1 hypothetical protein AYO22_07430 [Fonsecaea multimorphosa]
MSKIPWSITSTKRKTESAPLAARKRQRRSNIRVTSGSRPSKSQQTLTQAEWLTSIPSSYDESEMQYLDDGGQRQPQPPKKPRRSVRKPDSTLTQMDFFSSLPRHDQDFDDAMISVAEGEDDGRCVVPQLDGTYDSPRRPRKRKATPSAASLPTKQKTEPPIGDSQEEYKPSKRRRKVGFADEENTMGPRRASKRLASKNEVLLDPVKNFDYFAEALRDPAEHGRSNAADEPLSDFLEIEDATEDEPGILLSGCSVLPQTPKRNTTVILSSQSPESLCKSTHKSDPKVAETPSKARRLPLAERSVNIPTEASPTRNEGKRRRTPMRKSPKSKVVILKLRKRDSPRRPPYVGDSQVNLWSIPSSSPELIRGPATAVQAHVPPHKAPEDFEIPATSQAQGSGSTSLVAGSEDNLPNPSQLFARRSGGTKAEDAVDPTQEGNRGVIVRDFANAHSLPNGSATPGLDGIIRSSPPVPAESQDPQEPAGDSEETGEAVDFGSPIENDTQFNMQIQHRMSSSTPPEQRLEESGAGPNAGLLSTPPSLDGEDADKVDAAPCPASQDIGILQPSDSLPLIPRLVERCSADADKEAHELDDDDADEEALPEPAFVHPSTIHRKATQAPLNDTLHSSSSPSLSAARPVTQRSVHPASIPHPSQMSTQDVTQCFLPQSSIPPPPREGLLEGEPDKVTIKDSSSSSIPLSQIPQHVKQDESQLDGDNSSAEESASEDDLDLDLDPPSVPPKPSRPRAAFLQEDTEQPIAGKGRTETPMETKGRHSAKSLGPQSSSQLREPQSELESAAGYASEEPSLASSPEQPPPLQRQYSPIPGFNNDTQSNFTQGGHVTAAYIHRQRESGVFPKWFVPSPYQVPGYTRRK